MVVEVSVGDGDKVRSMRKVDQAVIGVLAHRLITGVIAMVDPYIRRKLNGSAIAVCSRHFADLHIAHDDIFLA
ncbi:putative pectate lyase B [Alternaria alternata]|nr:putative pectate lyase B [Alternaria alternata]